MRVGAVRRYIIAITTREKGAMKVTAVILGAVLLTGAAVTATSSWDTETVAVLVSLAAAWGDLRTSVKELGRRVGRLEKGPEEGK